MNSINPRTPTADLLKGLAVLFMIQVHIMELFADSSILNSDLGKVSFFYGGPLVAPVFMGILGYFIAASTKSVAQLIQRGLKIVGLGMLLNIALNLNLIVSVSQGLLQIDLLPYIFGVDILQFAGLSIIILALLKNVFKKHILIVLVGIVISSSLGYFLIDFVPENEFLKYVYSFFYGVSTWAYFPFFPWFSYPLTGIAFYQIHQKYQLSILKEPRTLMVLSILFVIFFILTGNYAVSVASNLPTYYHHTPLFFLWLIIFMFFYSYFINELNGVVGERRLFRYIKWLGKNVTVVFVIQWILIGNIGTEIYKTVSNPWYLFVWFVGILLLSSTLSYLYIQWRANKGTAITS